MKRFIKNLLLIFLALTWDSVIYGNDNPNVSVQLEHAKGVNSVAFSPDGKYILSGVWDGIRLWDVSSGTEATTFKGVSVYVLSVAFSPEGKYVLSGSSDKSLKLWDVSTGKEIRNLKGHSDWVRSVTFSPDGQYVLSASDDSTIKLWNVSTGEEVKTLNWHTAGVASVAFSPDGRYVLSGGRDYTAADKFLKKYVGKHSLRLGEVTKRNGGKIFKGHSDWINSVAFSPEGQYILSGSSDGTLKLWNVSTGKEVKTFKGHSDGVRSVAFSPDGKYALSGSDDRTIKLWDVTTGKTLRTLEGHSSYISSVAISQDGKSAVSGSQDGTIRVWNLVTGKEIAQMIEFQDEEWVVIIPEGYYNSSTKGDKYLSLRIGQKVFRIDRYRSTYFKPDVVAAALQSGDTYQAIGQVLGWEKEKTIIAAVKETATSKREAAQENNFPPKDGIEKPGTVYGDSKAEISIPSGPIKPKDRDTLPPKITILSPDITKKLRVSSKTSRIAVVGRATDESGVAEVTVNGEVVGLDERGNFSTDVLLKVRENEIIVAAIDIYKNETVQSFQIVREGWKGVISQVSPVPDIKGKHYGLMIGNNDYKYIPKLQTARKDASEVEKVLREQYGFETRLLLDATRMAILNAINELRKRLREEDSLLIYYAGHGDFDRIADKAYWLPVDAERDNPTNWIMSDDITTNIKRMASKHILIVSDSCYSETFVRRVVTDLSTKTDRESFIKRMLEKMSRTLMSSGGNEPVLDSGGSGHSVFAEAFLKGLREMEEKVFTADELFYGVIRERVIGKAEQTPQYNNIRNSGHEGGDFVFIKK